MRKQIKLFIGSLICAMKGYHKINLYNYKCMRCEYKRQRDAS